MRDDPNALALQAIEKMGHCRSAGPGCLDVPLKLVADAGASLSKALA